LFASAKGKRLKRKLGWARGLRDKCAGAGDDILDSRQEQGRACLSTIVTGYISLHYARSGVGRSMAKIQQKKNI